MQVIAKLRDNNSTVFNSNGPVNKDPAFFYFDFGYLPRVGELVLFQNAPGGLYIVCAVVHEIIENKATPIFIMEKYYTQTRQEVLRQYGWEPGDTISTNAFEVELRLRLGTELDLKQEYDSGLFIWYENAKNAA